MSAKVLMGVDEYLKTSFDGPDCEYLDGGVVERNTGELPHAQVQGNLYYLLRILASRLGIRVFPEIRIQISRTRCRVADVAVWRDGNIGDRIPTVPPFLAIEVVSPEDRITRMQPKIVEYLSIGVEWIWLIDPLERSAICFTQKNPAGVLTDVLRTGNPAIEITLADALDINR
jgi:Uma2 family endonuclease